MIFDVVGVGMMSPHLDFQERYSTLGEAKIGHADAVSLVRTNLDMKAR
jgi:hypothetical protein